MGEFAKQLDVWIDKADTAFAPYLVWTVLGTAMFFTLRCRFVQVTRFREAIRETIASQQTGASGALSPLQAFMTALAATIGTGNIVGVATAILKGGPGALFWIWCYGFLAMSTKFAEASLGVHYRVAHGEKVLSGPMYYLRDGLRLPALAWIYALVGAMAVLFTTPMTQTNSIAVSLAGQFHERNWSLGELTLGQMKIDANRLVIGIALAVLTWLVIVHGIKSIGRVAEKLSPIKVGFYLIGGAVVLFTHIHKVPEVLSMVFRGAFTEQAAVGGAVGYTMMMALRFGIARGVYANEAGYGTAAVTYGTAKSQRPEQQGLAAMMDVFIISFVTSTISAMVILLTGVWQVEGTTGPLAITAAFNAAMPGYGGWMVSISILLFGYTVLIGWEFYGEQFLGYMFGPRVVVPFRWVYCMLIPLGAIAKVDAVWNWGDICNGLQVFPNVVGLIGLSGLAAKYARSRASDGGT
jgi:AGCS family alanine or glycine:cation symporter